jgi:hypothetical protein
MARSEAWNQGIGAGLRLQANLLSLFAKPQPWTFRTHFAAMPRNARKCWPPSARDVVDKATWSRMAERLQACAKFYEDQLSALEIHTEPRRRKTH